MFRQLQVPINGQYNNDPTSTLVMLSSQRILSSTSNVCKLSIGPAIKEADLRVFGYESCCRWPGCQRQWRSTLEPLLLDALVACVGVTLVGITFEPSRQCFPFQWLISHVYVLRATLTSCCAEGWWRDFRGIQRYYGRPNFELKLER